MSASGSDSLFILRNLIAKDFKVRYRNMSLGIFWSLLNPLVMMGVLTFVFSVVFTSGQKFFPLFVLMGLLPYNFFTLAWGMGTNSIIDNGALVKKVPFRRELLPVSVVLANSLHYFIQLALLLAVVGALIGVSLNWMWLPVMVALQLVFVCGMALLCSALDVYYRDTRYVVESSNLVLFWLVPIFYGLDRVGQKYAWIYELNPVAAVVVMTRRILLEGIAPGWQTMGKMAAVSLMTLALGYIVFRRIEKDFADYL